MNKNNLDNWAISTEMFKWIENNLEKGKTILEFGSGTGTIELTKYWEVYSVEQHQKYVGLAPDSNYIYAPIKNGWYDNEIVFTNIPNKYDLIIIDGPQGPQYRSGIDKYLSKLNTNVPILLDDTHRTSDRNHAINVANQLGKQWTEIDGWQKKFIVIYP